MKFTAHKRKSKDTMSGRILYALVVLWVSVGLQPCAVAEVSDADCPHCPPAETHSIAPENEHCGGHTEATFDAIVSNECCDADDGAIDTRYNTIDLKDFGDVAPPPLNAGPPSPFWIVQRIPVVDPPDRRRSSVPLYILNCVYRN